MFPVINDAGGASTISVMQGLCGVPTRTEEIKGDDGASCAEIDSFKQEVHVRRIELLIFLTGRKK